MNNKKELSTRMKELRLSHGLTLKQMAEALDVKDNTLSQYENDKRSSSLGFTIRVARYFGVSLDYLLRESDIPSFGFNGDKSAIELILKMQEGDIDHDSIADYDKYELAVWITDHADDFNNENGKYHKYQEYAYTIVHSVIQEGKVLDRFVNRQRKDQDVLNKIEEKLDNANDMNYTGAQLSDIYTFIKESERVDFRLMENIMSIIKKLPDDDMNMEDESDYSLSDADINDVTSYILKKSNYKY